MPGLRANDESTITATPVPDDEIPPFLLSHHRRRSPRRRPGATAQAIVKVTPGGWAVFPDSNQAPVYLDVKDGAEGGHGAGSVSRSASPSSPSTGLDSEVKGGKQIWKVTNTGAEVHMLGLGKLPDGTTKDDVLALLNSEMSGTPVAGGLAGIRYRGCAGGVLLLSPGKRAGHCRISQPVPTRLFAGCRIRGTACPT